MQMLVPTEQGALRQNNFDAIRLGMALLVVWSHSFALWRGSEATEWVSLAMGGVYNSGNLAVLTFFAISGFLITFSWLRAKSWLSYLARRLARIHPGYLVATAICSLAVVPAFSSRAFGQISGPEIWGLVSNLWLRNFIIPSDAFNGLAVNGSLWSIPYEFLCYLGVMALGLFGLIRRRIVYPLAATALIAVRVWLDMTGRHPGGGMFAPIIGPAYLWFTVLPVFLLGGAVYLYRECIPRNRLFLVALIACTVGAAHLPFTDPLRTVVTRTLMPAALVYAIFYMAFDRRIRAHDAARFGDFSYGTYLYAFPIQQMLVASLKGLIPFPVFILLSLALSLAAGIASWYLVERWFLPRLRHGHHHTKDPHPLREEARSSRPDHFPSA